MRKTRGFRLGRKVVKLWKWLLKPKSKPFTAGYLRLSTSNLTKTRTMTKICNWGRRITQSLRPPLLRASSYSRINQTSFDEKPVPVPKGHMAIYVGQKDGDPHRFLVPIIYFNHPLFGQLLREAENEHGLHHPVGRLEPALSRTKTTCINQHNSTLANLGSLHKKRINIKFVLKKNVWTQGSMAANSLAVWTRSLKQFLSGLEAEYIPL